MLFSLISDVGTSDTSLPLVADSDEQKAPLTKGIKASNEDFHLSLPQYETPESEFHQKEKSLPGSYSSLDELCGRKKNKSKISKKLFGKKDNDESERELDEASKVSTVNIPNGKETTLKEYEVDIEICPIEHAPDKNEPDIDIYPLDQEVSIQSTDSHRKSTSLMRTLQQHLCVVIDLSFLKVKKTLQLRACRYSQRYSTPNRTKYL